VNDFKRDDLIADAVKYCKTCSTSAVTICNTCPLKGFLVDSGVLSAKQAYIVAGIKRIADFLAFLA